MHLTWTFVCCSIILMIQVDAQYNVAYPQNYHKVPTHYPIRRLTTFPPFYMTENIQRLNQKQRQRLLDKQAKDYFSRQDPDDLFKGISIVCSFFVCCLRNSNLIYFFIILPRLLSHLVGNTCLLDGLLFGCHASRLPMLRGRLRESEKTVPQKEARRIDDQSILHAGRSKHLHAAHAHAVDHNRSAGSFALLSVVAQILCAASGDGDDCHLRGGRDDGAVEVDERFEREAFDSGRFATLRV